MLPNSPIEQISRTLSDLEKRIERLERLDQVFTINPAETVINEAGIDRNLRIEGDNEPNLIFVDAGNDYVGIGTGAPARRLHILDDVNPQLVELSDAGTNDRPPITIFRRTTSGIPAVNFGYNIIIQAHNNANAIAQIAAFTGRWTDPTAGTEDSRMSWFIRDTGVNRERLRYQEDIVVFNFFNDDVDFQFETSGSANTLFIDGGNDNVGIGTGAPNASAALDITSTIGSLLIPRMTTVQRNALAAVNAMGIYNTTTNQFEKYEAGAWVAW